MTTPFGNVDTTISIDSSSRHGGSSTETRDWTAATATDKPYPLFERSIRDSWPVGRLTARWKINCLRLNSAAMSNKETKARVANAFRAMKAIGISEDKVKPVLKNLLKLYDKNWELIEEENYRALADAIFEREEAEVEERSKKIIDIEAAGRSKKTVINEGLEEQAQETEEPERPLKRLRLRYRDGQSSSSTAPNTRSAKMPLIQPKDEPSELPEACLPNVNASRGVVESPQPNAENTSVDSLLPHKNKGKQPISPKSLVVREECDPYQPSGIGRSPTHRMRLRDRGKGSVSTQIASTEKRSVAKTSTPAACLKEPKVEPDTVPSLKEKSIESHSLIIPKDEPVTDDMPDYVVPIAVIPPDPSSGGDSSGRNGTIRQHDSLEPSISQSLNEKERADGTAAPNEARKSGELAMTSGQCSSSLEIASSPSGEVKISLSCDLALGRPDFHMPSLETVLKLVEEKCLSSYKTLDPNFSVMNLMKEMCQCFLNLRSGSNNGAPATIDVAPTTDSPSKSSATDAVDARDLCFSSFNGSNDFQVDAEANLPKTPVITPCNGIDDGSHLKNKDGGDDYRTNVENTEICSEETNNLSLVIANQPQVTPEMIRSLHDLVDIAKGQEKVVITLVNEVNNESPPSFYYIPQNAVFQNAYVNLSLARIGDNNCCSTCFGDCMSLSTPCACAHKTGGEFAYTTDGLVKEELLKQCISMNRDPKKHTQFFCKECPLERSKSEDIAEPCKGHLGRKFIKECWWKCGCNKQCGNRVVQRGITRNLQVFMTPEGKGWGLRTLEDLPKGAFVCEYVGEILTNVELFDRVLRRPQGEKHSYPVFLDADWGAEGVMKDEEALCLDAAYYGNVARFINHRCYDSNLVEIPVEVETPDHHYYHLAFFTTGKVNAMEELTWDYGIDFDDHDHPIKAFRCQCGSKCCRNIKRSRSRTARR